MVSFTNGVLLQTGGATADVSESGLRRIQIREAIKARFEKEEKLFEHGTRISSPASAREFNELRVKLPVA